MADIPGNNPVGHISPAKPVVSTENKPRRKNNNSRQKETENDSRDDKDDDHSIDEFA